MKSKKKVQQEEQDENLGNNIQNPDDSLKPIKENIGELPKIYKISKRGKTLNRKKFIKSAVTIAGLAAFGNLLKSCEESELDILKNENNCECHAVCSCDSEVDY